MSSPPPADEGIAASPDRPSKDPAGRVDPLAPRQIDLVPSTSVSDALPPPHAAGSLDALLGMPDVLQDDAMLSTFPPPVDADAIVHPQFRQGIQHTIEVARAMTENLVEKAAHQMRLADGRAMAFIGPLSDIPGPTGDAIRPNPATGETLPPGELAAAGYQTAVEASSLLQLADQAAPIPYRHVLRREQATFQYNTILGVWRAYWQLAGDMNLAYDPKCSDPIKAITEELQKLARKGRREPSASAKKRSR